MWTFEVGDSYQPSTHLKPTGTRRKTHTDHFASELFPKLPADMQQSVRAAPKQPGPSVEQSSLRGSTPRRTPEQDFEETQNYSWDDLQAAGYVTNDSDDAESVESGEERDEREEREERDDREEREERDEGEGGERRKKKPPTPNRHNRQQDQPPPGMEDMIKAIYALA